MTRLHKAVVAEFEKYKKEHKVKGLRKKRLSLPDSGDNDEPKLKQRKLCWTSSNAKCTQNQKQFEQNVVNYVIKSMKLLSTVDDENFRKIFTDIDPNLKMLSRRTLGRKVTGNYEDIIQYLKEKFKTVRFVSTTADVWSTKHRSFMGVTAHWIEITPTNTTKRESCVLDCCRFKGTHSYDRIAEVLLDIFSKFGLKHEQLVSTVTDNGSNFVKAFAEFGVSLRYDEDSELHSELDLNDSTEGNTQTRADDDKEHEQIDFECISDSRDHGVTIVDECETQTSSSITLPHHIRCGSHTLSLLATTDLHKIIKSSAIISRLHYPAFAKCTELWNKSRRPKTSEIITNHLGCSLLYPCPTRWNSLYDSTSQLLKYKTQLNNLHSLLNIGKFKDIELEYLEEFCIVMKPLATALDFLQREKDCFYGQFLPTLFSLRQRLRSLQENHLRHTSFIVNGLISDLEKRFDKFFKLLPEVDVNEAILATCFHPTFKLRWLPPECTNDERERIQNLCKNELEKAANEVNNNDNLGEQFNNASSSAAGDEEEFFVFSPQRSETKQQSHTELEPITFFNDRSKSLDSLNNYALIRKLFIQFNTSLCSSAPVERLFSFGGLILCPNRGGLTDTTFQKLIFLKGNAHFP